MRGKAAGRGGGDAGRGGHLLVVSLHAEEDEVGRGAGQAALQVGAASDLLGLRVKAIESLHHLLKELPLDLGAEKERAGRGSASPAGARWQVGAGLTARGPHGRGQMTLRTQVAPERPQAPAGEPGDLGSSQTWPSTGCVTLGKGLNPHL